MAGNRGEFDCAETAQSLEQMLEQVRVDGCELTLTSSQIIGSKLIVEVALKEGQAPSHFPELQTARLAVVCDHDDGRDFLHQLCRALIQASDRYLEELISFDGFKRFSHNLCPEKLAEFSYQTRNISVSDARFDAAFSDMSYRVDAAKAPVYNRGLLGQQQRAMINKQADLAGYLPLEAD